MEIAVTGGAGFIGSHLSEELIEQGHDLTVIDNLASGKIDNIAEEAEFEEIDIKNDDLSL
jgi:UDP-glucose 4-epimerase